MAPERKLFRGNFVSSLCRAFFLGVGILRLGVLSLGVWGVVLLLVLQRLGEYYSYVGRQISLSFNIGAWARLL